MSVSISREMILVFRGEERLFNVIRKADAFVCIRHNLIGILASLGIETTLCVELGIDLCYVYISWLVLLPSV